ncbi:SUMF1/EgtB/PvdO family nonheme iron enzyme [Candidatus Uabimicrobium sp. HlEnr_7]|uniref:nSTAND1 domain-containing NTPase n=1 Tax=Candidatus Uabimicrobium helgolandensis TaxID=3095367 RepID=UPI0035582362
MLSSETIEMWIKDYIKNYSTKEKMDDALRSIGINPSYIEQSNNRIIYSINIMRFLDSERLKTWFDTLSQESLGNLFSGKYFKSQQTSPYRGLLYFREEDSTFLFGRENITKKLFSLVEKKSTVLVNGLSKSGKSSLVFAGLIPKLRYAKQQYLIISFRPGYDPFYTFSMGLIDLLYPDKTKRNFEEVSIIAKKLRSETSYLQKVLDSVLVQKKDHELVIIIDQFEELYTLCDEKMRKDFLKLIYRNIKKKSNPKFRLVITTISDFYPHCVFYKNLERILEQSTILLDSMSKEEITDAITKPAKVMGVEVEPKLVKTLLQDTNNKIQQMALLEFILALLWEKKIENKLTLSSYQQYGGLKSIEEEYLEASTQKIFDEIDMNESLKQYATEQRKSLILLSVNDTSNTQSPEKEILAYNLNQILQKEDLWKQWNNSSQKWDEPQSNWDELPPQMQKWIDKGNITNYQRVVVNRWILENVFPEAFESTSHLYTDKVDTDKSKKDWIEAIQPTAKPALEGKPQSNTANEPPFDTNESESNTANANKSESYVSNYNTKHLRQWWVIALLHFVLLLSVAAMWSLRSDISDILTPEVISLDYLQQNVNQGKQQAKLQDQKIVVTTLERTIELSTSLSNLENAAFSTTGKYLAAISEYNNIELWDTSIKKRLARPWQINGVNTTDELYAVAVQNNTVWMVGNNRILRSTDRGQSWVFFTVDAVLQDVYVSAVDNSVWAVGKNGVILRSKDGEIWQKQQSGTQVDLHAICGNKNNVWVTGDNGTVLSWDGEHWQSLVTQTRENLYAIDVNNDGSRLYTVGANGIIVSYEKNKLLPQKHIGSFADLLAVNCDDTKVWCCGKDGVFAYSVDDGAHWNLRHFSQKMAMYDIAVEGSQVWCAGEDRLFYSVDRGENWVLRMHGNQQQLRGICFDSQDYKLWLCGRYTSRRISQTINFENLGYSKSSAKNISARKILDESQTQQKIVVTATDPKSEIIAAAFQNGVVGIYARNGSEIITLQTGKENIDNLAFHSQQQKLAYSTQDGIYEWDITTALVEKKIYQALPFIPKLQMSYTGPKVAELGEDVFYAVTIRNNGSDNINNISLKYTYDSKIMDYQNAEPFVSQLQNQKLTWKVDKLSAGEIQQWQIRFRCKIAGTATMFAKATVSANIVQQIKILTNVGPKGWDIALWEECWDKENEWLNYTGEKWSKLSAEKQAILTTAYQEWYAEKYNLELIKKFRRNKIEFVFKLVPPGKFWMGSDRISDYEKPRHKVIISKPMWVGETEVTQRQWLAIMGDNPAHFQVSGLDAPVESVSWNDCNKFTKKLGWSLLSEAQWEYTCRSGTTTEYYWGEQNINDYVWYRENSNKQTHPVKQKKPNAYSLYDMSGNVWERCLDTYQEYSPEEVKDPLIIDGLRHVLRGGCYFDLSVYCRSASRLSIVSGFELGDFGLRLLFSSSE